MVRPQLKTKPNQPTDHHPTDKSSSSLTSSTNQVFLLNFSLFSSNGGSDKQHMDSSSDSEMDGPMHDGSKVLNVTNNNNNNTSSHNLSATASTSNLTAQTLQMQLTAASSHHVQQLAPSASSLIQTAAGSSKNLGQLSSSAALSAVAYSHLHSVMGNMPIYDMSDYQHL